MAEAIISLLIEKLGSHLLDKFGSIYRLKKELNNLRSTLTAIQAVLKDAEEQQWTSNTIRDWLDKLEDVAFEVGDIFDEFATEDLRRRVEIRNSTTKKVRDFFTPSKNPIAFKCKMTNKVKEVAERLDVIAREKSNYNLRHEDVVDRRKEARARVQTHSFVHESEALGRKEDNDKLVHLLVNRGDEEEENVSIVPIVGMGGLGKTTLAKLVYNDERVMSYFDKLIWVFVSEKFDSAEIMRAIVESDQGRCDVERMESLQSLLRKTLSGKRYLLVLDDIWNENQEAWLLLKSLLNVGEKGSKIIATTRSNIVANIMGTLPTHHLEGLPEEDCWSLFKQRAFPNRDEQTYPDLVLIGREIVKKCKGVPLVAKVLGGLLHYKRSEREWRSIRNNEIWELKEDQIMPTLRLSYNHLPSQLKQCFTYCIIFHKGDTFKQQEVIQMWIAQGLIQSSEEGKLMEDIGGEYFDELYWRSFFQEEDMYHVRGLTKEPGFKMHDHIYDLAKSVRRTECLTVKARRIECVPSKTRHFSFILEESILLTDLMSTLQENVDLPSKLHRRPLKRDDSPAQVSATPKLPHRSHASLSALLHLQSSNQILLFLIDPSLLSRIALCSNQIILFLISLQRLPNLSQSLLFQKQIEEERFSVSSVWNHRDVTSLLQIAVAAKNKANRSSQKLRHTGGTKSFARHRDEEMRSRTDGSIPSRADLFIRTHSRKDGTPVDEKSTEIISKFKELSAAQEGGSSSSIGDDIYTQVMGAERHGRVRGYGLGPTPTSVFGSTSSQSQAAFAEVQIELSSMHEKLQQMEEWKKNQEEEKRQMEEWKKNQEEEKRAHLEEMKLLHAIIAEMRQRLSPRRQDPSEGGAD